MTKQYRYECTITWKGNLGQGTRDYKAYSRDYEVAATGKPLIPGSSDPSFRGDGARYSPEDLLLSSLSGCHMLWYLHLCAVNGVVVMSYSDDAQGEMAENEDGSGHFTAVTLHPKITVAEEAMVEKARSLHANAHQKCFIARSVNFPVRHVPQIQCAQRP